MAHKKTFFWTVRMGDIKFGENKKFNSVSKHMILDSGLSYALIPSADFASLTQMLNTEFGVNCIGDAKKDNFSAQVASSSCTCKNYGSLPALKMQLLANADDKQGKQLVMPRQTYMKDIGDGKCELLLNPNDMQIGAIYGEDYWVMGD